MASLSPDCMAARSCFFKVAFFDAAFCRKSDWISFAVVTVTDFPLASFPGLSSTSDHPMARTPGVRVLITPGKERSTHNCSQAIQGLNPVPSRALVDLRPGRQVSRKWVLGQYNRPDQVKNQTSYDQDPAWDTHQVLLRCHRLIRSL